MGVFYITCSSVISTLHDEAELENYLTKKEAKYHKICTNCYDSQKLEHDIDNRNSISEPDNSIEPFFLFLVHFERKNARCCPALSAANKIYQRISMLLILIMLKGKKLMLNTRKYITKNWKRNDPEF